MSELSYLEKLLDGVEVEWLPLGKSNQNELKPTKITGGQRSSRQIYHTGFTAGKKVAFDDKIYHGIY